MPGYELPSMLDFLSDKMVKGVYTNARRVRVLTAFTPSFMVWGTAAGLAVAFATLPDAVFRYVPFYEAHDRAQQQQQQQE